MIEWCAVRHGSKNGHQKNMSLIEIGLQCLKLLSLLGSTVNVIRGLM